MRRPPAPGPGCGKVCNQSDYNELQADQGSGGGSHDYEEVRPPREFSHVIPICSNCLAGKDTAIRKSGHAHSRVSWRTSQMSPRWRTAKDANLDQAVLIQ